MLLARFVDVSVVIAVHATISSGSAICARRHSICQCLGGLTSADAT